MDPQSSNISRRFLFGEHHVPLPSEYIFDNGLDDETVEAINQGCGEIEYGVGRSFLVKKSRTRKNRTPFF